MRMSCNGCRVLRKGCSDDCIIRPCLQWIPSPDSQANATLFLAKFYGRAGLINLINAGPPHLRPAIFRSLLYEACGRIVNPVEGSVGLLCSGNWARCEAAVDGVLRGTTTMPEGLCSDAAAPVAALSNPAIKAFDIRHVSRESSAPGVAGPTRLVTTAATTKPRSKTGAPRSRKPRDDRSGGSAQLPGWSRAIFTGMTSRTEPSFAAAAEAKPAVVGFDDAEDRSEVGLELCLGLGRRADSANEVWARVV